VSTELDAFELIIPCGQRSTQSTSLAREVVPGRPLHQVPTVAELARPLGAALGAAFGRQIRFTTSIPTLQSRPTPVE
jgi:lipoate-protein ligase B